MQEKYNFTNNTGQNLFTGMMATRGALVAAVEVPLHTSLPHNVVDDSGGSVHVEQSHDFPSRLPEELARPLVPNSAEIRFKSKPGWYLFI